MNYYAPFYRPMGYYNPTVPQENLNIQGGQPFGQPTQNPIPQNSSWNDMLWVLNETEAVSYPVAPNNSVTLWDKNQDTVYIKSVNMQGVPSMRILDYKERINENTPKTPQNHECKCGKDFVRIEAFEALQKDLEALRKEIKALKVEDDEDGK